MRWEGLQKWVKAIALFLVILALLAVIGWMANRPTVSYERSGHPISKRDALEVYMKLNENISDLVANSAVSDDVAQILKSCKPECCFDPLVDRRIFKICGDTDVEDLEDMIPRYCSIDWSYSSCNKNNVFRKYRICDISDISIAQFEILPCNGKRMIKMDCDKPTCQL